MNDRTFRWPLRGRWYTTLEVQSNKRRVQVTESPTGRSLQVHVLDEDGWRKVYP